MTRWRALLLLPVIALAACAHPATPLDKGAGNFATARDLGNDRILVTLPVTPPGGTATLSPSGRLNYLPPDAADIRREQLQKAHALAKDYGLELEEDWPIPALDVYCFVFRVKNPAQQGALVTRLGQRPDIDSVQALQFFHGKGTPSHDHESPQASGRDPLANWNEDLNRSLLAAHRSATGKSVTIAVIDTGADTGHEDLRGATMTAMDFVDGKTRVPAETHGTAIVGLLAARPDNGIGIRGYAPDARILLLRACWETADAMDESASAVCNSFTLAKALSFALTSDADIVSLSISGPRDPLLERLAGKLVQDARLLIVAGESSAHFPASVDNSIVAARQPAALHSGGPALTLLPNDRYGLREGTSITTARVAGVAALMKELDPALTAGEFRLRLRSGADVFVDISQILRSDSIRAAHADAPVIAPGK